ncbi:MAG: RusA family crossover junction endodeoxyribonuclease [Thermotogota bacterium]|nr:RusA family crossover junction endodeoxyribonuclease [Thermotogota bacterium]
MATQISIENRKEDLMQLNLILPNSIRSKKNSKIIVWRGGKQLIISSKAYRRWEKEARESIHMQMLQKNADLIEHPVEIEAQIYYKGNRPDLSGCLESIGDCLEGVVIKNDRQIISWDGSRVYYDKNNPRTELSLFWVENQNEKYKEGQIYEIKLLKEENTKLRKAARLIHRRGRVRSGSEEMGEIDDYCKSVGLEVWKWPR